MPADHQLDHQRRAGEAVEIEYRVAVGVGLPIVDQILNLDVRR
jgi:hypothetical protein